MMIEEKEIAEIRRIRHQISAQFGHDPRKVVAHYRSVEKEYRESDEFSERQVDKAKDNFIPR
jgi:hypothetical protein